MLSNIMKLKDDVWIDYENSISDRVCGGKTVLPLNSVVLFAPSDSGNNIEFSFQLANPLNDTETVVLEFGIVGGEDIHGVVETHRN
jgi:hypothetical protein